MVRVRTGGPLTPAELVEVLRMLDAAQAGDARLNDHLRLDLAQGPRPGFIAALAHDGPTLVGYAQASAGNDGHIVDAIVAPSAPDPATLRIALLTAVIQALPSGGAITWWAGADDASAATATAVGLAADRGLLKMVRDLPIDVRADVLVRSFVVGHDEAAWLAVNNAAFAAHGEQGGWDDATLRQREREPWFDPAGFLLHERDGRLAAFCWTKLHPGEAPDCAVAGEIYVIAVHPDFHGQGLGKALTVAGLQHLQAAGATTAMLYVDAANASAVRLYESLGFTVSHTQQSYLRPPLEHR
ncbi:MAG: mycothiol synthase [Actinomycetota bacterium]|nr:mycothiol synthase [Actinomycetota bacterium]